MLSPNQKLALRTGIQHYCQVAELFEREWAYDQERPFGGQQVAPRKMHRNDCSGYVSLAFGYAAQHLGLKIADPLGDRWTTGNTETAHTELRSHHAPVDRYRIGDIAIYGTLGVLRSQHMTICRRAGSAANSIWSSHGETSGPEPRPLHDPHKPLIGVYRHPALL